MVPKGESIWRAMWYSFISSLPQPLLSVPSFLLVERFQVLLPIGLGLATGAMLWLVISEIIPEGLAHCPYKQFSVLFATSFACMYAVNLALHCLRVGT